MLDRLWAPWRMDYVTTASKKAGCVFCDALEINDDRRSHILFRGRLNFVIMNIYPYNSGHVMIVPFEHVASPLEAPEGQTEEMVDLIKLCQAALTHAYKAEGFNIGMNIGKCAGAGVLDHYHLHIVPRWGGDTNYITVLGETRVLAEELDSSYNRLLPHFERASERPEDLP